MKRIASLALAIGLFATTATFSQIAFDGSPGTAAPPGTLGPYTMTAFPADPAADGAIVTTAPGPTGNVVFNLNMNHRIAGYSWSTWSHGYTGDVYWTQGVTSVTMTMPSGTQAFYFYAEPNTYAVFTVTATAQDGATSGPINVNGNSGATYFGFYSTNNVPLQTISVTCGDGSGFAIGEFGICQCTPVGISVSMAPDMLWPPNHTMRSIHATVNTTGNCGSNTVTLVSVTSNEPDNGCDDGNTINDIQDVTTGVADYDFMLRAERSGIGTGRVYTAMYQAVDAYGYSAVGYGYVYVPLSMSKSGADIAGAPSTLELDQNYPNPFNPSTTINYGVPNDGYVTLAVYDLMGREVATLVSGEMTAGMYRATFNAQSLASGIYVYRLSLDGETTYRTMTLSK